MAKSFPNFPIGSTGFGILVVRVAGGLLLALGSVSPGPPDWMELPAVVLALALILGVMTRAAGPLGALLALWAAPSLHQAPLPVLGLCALNLAALSLLGGGAYSVDALLFGRTAIRLNK